MPYVPGDKDDDLNASRSEISKLEGDGAIAFYCGLAMLCTPGSLSQEVGLALGAQAGERRLRDALSKGGFTRVRRAAETPFSMILEARS